MIEVHHYSDNYFNQVLVLLNKSKKLDHFTDVLLHEKLYDDPDWNPQQTLLAIENQTVVGFMQGVTRHIRGIHYGYIKLMAVDPDFQRMGIATMLFNKLEALFIKKNVTVFRIYDVPLNYFMPGIDPKYTPAICFAQKMGFSHTGDAINMNVDLQTSNWEVDKQIETLNAAGISITRATPKDKPELFNFISVEWALWQNELEMAYRSEPISIYIARQDGKIKAFSAYNGNNIGTGWFGPMGTHSDLRGKGIGSILLYLCLGDMKKQGLTNSTIPWVAPIGFYSHYANAVISRIFWRFEKKLNHA